MVGSWRGAATLVAAIAVAAFSAPVAAAATGTPGSEYDVTFSGSASAHIVSTSHDAGTGNETNSADQTANWKVIDNAAVTAVAPDQGVVRSGGPREHRNDSAHAADRRRDRHRDPDREVHAGHHRGPVLMHRLDRL